MLFSLLKHYLDTDTALIVSRSLHCFTTFISHGVEKYFPRLWGTGISDAIFIALKSIDKCWKKIVESQVCLYNFFLASGSGVH